MNQKDAVYTVISSILKERNISIEDAHLNMSKEVKQLAADMINEMFKTGILTCNSIKEDSKLKKYSYSVVLNWIVKDPRIASKQYKPKTKIKAGSRYIKETKKLLKRVEGTEYERIVRNELAKLIVER